MKHGWKNSKKTWNRMGNGDRDIMGFLLIMMGISDIVGIWWLIDSGSTQRMADLTTWSSRVWTRLQKPTKNSLNFRSPNLAMNNDAINGRDQQKSFFLTIRIHGFQHQPGENFFRRLGAMDCRCGMDHGTRLWFLGVTMIIGTDWDLLAYDPPT